MKLEINVEKRHLFIFLGAVLVFAGIFLVIAQVAPNPGHDISQIGGLPICSSEQALTYTSSGLACINKDNLTNLDSAWVGYKWVGNGVEISCTTNNGNNIHYARVRDGTIEVRVLGTLGDSGWVNGMSASVPQARTFFGSEGFALRGERDLPGGGVESCTADF